ncbi:MAG: hypothetical protein IBX48_09800 [Thiomicrospira sp.]|uniref:hypothetical protein n=1 Tax=Thiomicrospira sp. TaxID=935 RepID=UPI0019EEBE36|nr:hypothetical protein [Thiomicrospira sp.]MBE0494618.1 hypothetical protein [Thiomicrospira sp.]
MLEKPLNQTTLVKRVLATLAHSAFIAFGVSMLVVGLLAFAIVFVQLESGFSIKAMLSADISILVIPLFLLLFVFVFWLVTLRRFKSLLENDVLPALNELSDDISHLRLIDPFVETQQKFEFEEVQHIYEKMMSHLKNLKTIYKNLDLLNVTDNVTGLFKRKFFYEIIKHQNYVSKRYKRPYSLMLIKLVELNHPQMKDIEKLNLFAQLMIDSIRQSDMLFYVTDKAFILVAADTDAPGIEQLSRDFGCRILEVAQAYSEFECHFELGYATYGEQECTNINEMIHTMMSRLFKVELDHFDTTIAQPNTESALPTS